MAVSTLDVLIAAPCVPLLPILITWWLPWERWIPWGKLPKIALGPYLLYASFVAWHFGLGRFSTMVVFLAGVVVSGFGISEIIDKRTG
jgi:hypothetical protein